MGSQRFKSGGQARAQKALFLKILAVVTLALVVLASNVTPADAQRAYRLKDGRIMYVYPNGQRVIMRSQPQRRPVKKQSFFSKLFGGNNNSSPAAGVRYHPAPPRSYYNSYMPRTDRRQQLEAPARPKRSAGFRTMCVRKCDGYYFPISFSASSRDLKRDADACSNRCSSESQLYYYPNRGNVENMVNLDGERYKKLKTAFVYRKKRVLACSCRPEPWSDAAKNKHMSYRFRAEEQARLAREKKEREREEAEARKREEKREAFLQRMRSHPFSIPVDWT